MTNPEKALGGVQFFLESDLATKGAFARRLHAWLSPEGDRAAAADVEWNDQAGPQRDKVVAALVAPHDRCRAIRIAVEIGLWAVPPPVLLVVDDLTAGEYDLLVNRGAVRYVYNPADSVDLILCGLYAATRTQGTPRETN